MDKRPLNFYYSTIIHVGVWTFARYAHRRWKVFIRDSDGNRLLMTGSDVTTELHIPFAHRFLSWDFYHTDTDGAASTDSLTITVRRTVGKSTHPTRLGSCLYSAAHTSTNTTLVVPLEHEMGLYDLVLNTTDTDYVVPCVYLLELEK